MMMNADVVLDDFGDNISNVSTTVESALNEVDDLQLSGLGLSESLDSASAYFSGVGSNIRSLVYTAFENYRDALPDGTTSVPLAALVSGLNTNLPDQLPSNIGNPVFSASDNELSGLLYDGKNVYQSKTYRISPMVDRVGGGDAFAAGIIHTILDNRNPQDIVDFGVATSVLKHTIPGDYNLVNEEEVKVLMDGNSLGRVSR